jgi:hypothetical protein
MASRSSRKMLTWTCVGPCSGFGRPVSALTDGAESATINASSGSIGERLQIGITFSTSTLAASDL